MRQILRGLNVPSVIAIGNKIRHYGRLDYDAV
jgi:hypothetical protein